MAILKGTRVTIVSGGKELAEKCLPHDEAGKGDVDKKSKRVTYIEAMPNTNFAVKFELRNDFAFSKSNFVDFCLHLDGEWVGGRVCTKSEFKSEKRTWESTCEGSDVFVDAHWELRPFRWGSLQTSEQPCNDQEKKRYQQLGTIRVEVLRKIGGSTEEKPEKVNLEVGQAIPEKAIKGAAVDLQASFDTAKASGGADVWAGKNFDQKPLAVFVFKYRSKEALQTLGILKRPVTPVPLEERDEATLSKEELVELARRLKEAQRVKIKQEKTDANLAELAELKRCREEDDDDDVEVLESPPVKKVCSIEQVVIDDSD
ncbi:hypothetical protein H2200_005914 [Cladophialophora chaetospira]|uniref:DUF7918 domain-containing protein n=1 Tax=Cladophialophora chaetospira TaxID=386627 RepID=A0AA38X9Y3_9EURO|nr:hypothetical protein H2200_005914 [Cladophialophora chaetospira]